MYDVVNNNIYVCYFSFICFFPSTVNICPFHGDAFIFRHPFFQLWNMRASAKMFVDGKGDKRCAQT